MPERYTCLRWPLELLSKDVQHRGGPSAKYKEFYKKNDVGCSLALFLSMPYFTRNNPERVIL